MSAAQSVSMVPHRPFVAIFAGLVLTVAAVGVARLSGFEPESGYPPTPPEASRMLSAEDAPQGAVVIRDARTGEVIHTFKRAEGSFLRATLRALVNDRRKQGGILKGDFLLERHQGGRLYLIDGVTGRKLALNAYGPDNSAVFAAFMSTQKGEGQ